MKLTSTTLFLVLAIFGIVYGCSNPNAPTKVKGEPTTTSLGVQYWDILVGSGATAVAGNTVKVHYTGWLTNGQKFDSSRDRSEPFSFKLGAPDIIRGWNDGIAGMKVGGKRQLRIPPALGYGDNDRNSAIPPNSTLICDIELLEVSN